jgi:hypothetical protein
MSLISPLPSSHPNGLPLSFVSRVTTPEAKSRATLSTTKITTYGTGHGTRRSGERQTRQSG